MFFLPLNCLCNYIVCFALKYMSLSHILPLSLETFDLVIASSSFVLISHLYSACLEFLRTVLFCLPSLPFQASRAFLSIALWQKRISVTGDFLHTPYLLIIFILQQPYRYQTCKKWWCSFRKHRQQNVTRCDKNWLLGDTALNSSGSQVSRSDQDVAKCQGAFISFENSFFCFHDIMRNSLRKAAINEWYYHWEQREEFPNVS